MEDFGKPVYNILSVAESPHKSNPIPLGLYDSSVRVLEEAGILGRHHVTEKGFFLDGFADGVERRINVVMEIFYRRGQSMNALEIAAGIKRKK